MTRAGSVMDNMSEQGLPEIILLKGACPIIGIILSSVKIPVSLDVSHQQFQCRIHCQPIARARKFPHAYGAQQFRAASPLCGNTPHRREQLAAVGRRRDKTPQRHDTTQRRDRCVASREQIDRARRHGCSLKLVHPKMIAFQFFAASAKHL